jgi:hypothetical protein
MGIYWKSFDRKNEPKPVLLKYQLPYEEELLQNFEPKNIKENQGTDENKESIVYASVHSKTCSGNIDIQIIHQSKKKNYATQNKYFKKKGDFKLRSNTKTSLRSLKSNTNQELVRTSLEIEHEKNNHSNNFNSQCASKKSITNSKIEKKAPPILNFPSSKQRIKELKKKNKDTPLKKNITYKYSSLKIIHKKQTSTKKMDTMKSYESIRSIKEKIRQSKSLLKKSKQMGKSNHKVRQASKNKTKSKGNLHGNQSLVKQESVEEGKKVFLKGRGKDETIQIRGITHSKKQNKIVKREFKFLHLFNKKQLVGLKDIIPKDALEEVEKPQNELVESSLETNRLSSIFHCWEKMIRN